MFCWQCFSIYACNGTNLMHYLSSVFSVTIPLHVSSLLVVHHQEVTIYICDNWYVLYVLFWLSAGLAGIESNSTRPLMHYLSSVYSVTTPLHVSGLLVAHHQEVTLYTVRSQRKGAVSKVNKKLFLTLHRHNVHRQQGQLSKFLMCYHQFASHAYCGASFQDGVAAGKGFLCPPFWSVQICDYSAAWVLCTV
jgi:hypothetical protein